jgi:predicted amidohydrolase YtcJ
MGTSFQGIIKTEKGRIRYMKTIPGFVQIDSENNSFYFKNAFALPGFTDSHGHIASLGSKLTGLDLSACSDSEECAVSAWNNPKEKGNWIVASGWNQELWKKKNNPDKKILDKYFPDTPVCFTRIDGHAVWVNSKALKLAGINNLTKNPEGGLIEKDKSGNPTGILHDNAIDLIKKMIPDYSRNQIKKQIKIALKELVKYGITSVHDMDVNPCLIPAYNKLNDENKIPLRIYSFISGHKEEWLKNNISPQKRGNFNIIGVKFYADGSLGSRSAAMLNEYSDKKKHFGIFLTTEMELYSRIKKALSSNFHIAVHAIGDAANRMVLDTFQNILLVNKDFSRMKLRIEHAQHIHPDDYELFNDERIIASVQPIHCISDAASITEKRLGERCKYAYPWKSLYEQGVKLISGSDFPIESHNPLIGIEALTRRIPFGSKESWFPDEILDIDTAVKTYTDYPNLATETSSSLGKLKADYLADMVILDKDIYSYPEISKINILATFVDGKRVY